jgi:hypothetical protein
MDANIEMLNYIYQNSQMGQDTLDHLRKINKDENFKNLLDSQFNEYKNIYDTTEQKLRTMGKEAKEIGPITKMRTDVMINLDTLTDKTPSHISEMLIQGNSMGIIDITKKLREYKNVNPDIMSIGQQLLHLEQQNIEECKKFL